MRRRKFITLLGSAAAWPLMARAQQPTMPMIGYISSASAGEPSTYLAPFRQGLGQVGYVEGRTSSPRLLLAHLDHMIRGYALRSLATALQKPPQVQHGNAPTEGRRGQDAHRTQVDHSLPFPPHDGCAFWDNSAV